MRKYFWTVVAAFFLTVALVTHAQAPEDKGGDTGGGKAGGKGKGKGFGKGGAPAFKNVQVVNQAILPETMQSFVQALGLLDQGACAYLPRSGPVLRRKRCRR